MANFDDFDDLLEVKDVMVLLKMSRNCVYHILQSRELKGYQQGRSWRIPKQAVIDYIEKRAGMAIY